MLRLLMIGHALLVFLASAPVQEPTPKSVAVQQSTSQIVARLHAEATKLETGDLSPVFKAIVGFTANNDSQLTREQIDLVQKCERLTRDVIKTWLLRGLEAEPIPSPSSLAERLTVEGNLFRASLIGHFEAILLDGVLTQAQAKSCRDLIGRRSLQSIPNQNPKSTMDRQDDRTNAQLVEQLRATANSFKRTSKFIYIILGEPGARTSYPDGLDQFDPMLRRMISFSLPKVDIAKNEADLAERLDELTTKVVQAWLVRDLQHQPFPPRVVLISRMGEGGTQLINKLVDHFTEILFRGILTPVEGEYSLAAFWKQEGVWALLDPILSSRLRLTKNQRAEISSLLQAQNTLLTDGNLDLLLNYPVTQPDLQPAAKKLSEEANAKVDEMKGMIWELLTPAQIRRLKRMLNIKSPPYLSPSTKVRPK